MGWGELEGRIIVPRVGAGALLFSSPLPVLRGAELRRKN